MYQPTANDELTGLESYLHQQLSALRAAAIGLTDEQIRMRPCRSALSIGGLLEQVTHGMTGATERLASPTTEPAGLDEAAFAAYMGAFQVGDHETAQEVVAAFDAARVGYLATVRGADPSAASVEPPAPWFGIYDTRRGRADGLISSMPPVWARSRSAVVKVIGVHDPFSPWKSEEPLHQVSHPSLTDRAAGHRRRRHVMSDEAADRS